MRLRTALIADVAFWIGLMVAFRVDGLALELVFAGAVGLTVLAGIADWRDARKLDRKARLMGEME